MAVVELAYPPSSIRFDSKIIPLSMAERNSRKVRIINPLGNLLLGLPEETKRTIRKFEKVALKINSTELAVIFNKTLLLLVLIYYGIIIISVI